MHFEIYRSRSTERSETWRWRLVAANGRIIADSAEGYSRESDCRHGIELVKGTGASTPVVER